MDLQTRGMSDRGHVLYTAQFHTVLRVVQRIGIGVVALMTLGMVAGLLWMGTVPELPASPRVVFVVLAACLLVVGGLFTWSMLRSSRMALVVRTAGIEVRGAWRDRWIPWERVARVETSDHWYWRRATQIVTVDGERVIATVTGYQNLYFRGEETDPSHRDHRLPQLPTRQAIDAHRRWLSGQRQR